MARRKDKENSITAAYLRPPRLGPCVVTAALALNLLALAMPLVTLQIFDRVIPNEARATLLILFLALCLVAACEFALRVAQVHLAGRTGADYECALARGVMDHVLNAVPRDFERQTTGAHLERFGAIAQLREHAAGQGRLLAVDLPFTVIFVAMIAVIGGWLALVPVVILATLAISGLVSRSWQADVLQQRKVVDGRRYSFLIEFLGAIATIKSNRMESQMTRRYELLNRQSVDASRNLIRVSAVTQAFGAVVGQVAVAAMGLAGAVLVIENAIGIGDLAACMMLNGRTTQPMLKLMGMLGQGESVGQARRRISDLAAVPRRPRIAQPAEWEGRVTLDRVGLAHPVSGVVLFDGLCAEVAPGEGLRLTGRDGAGRTSLMRLVLGEQAPTSGAVLIDGIPAHRMSAARGSFGIVYLHRDPVILRGTVMENLTLFGQVTDRDAILDAASETGLADEVRALPYGFQTDMADGGGKVSKGFLQLIALTRALGLAPRVLLVNHATSAMDRGTLQRAATCLENRLGTAALLLATDQAELGALAAKELRIEAPRTRAAVREWNADLAEDAAEILAEQAANRRQSA